MRGRPYGHCGRVRSTGRIKALIEEMRALDRSGSQATSGVDPQVLANIATALRLGGRFVLVDVRTSSHLQENVDHPFGSFLYGVSTLHCMPVSLEYGGEGRGAVWGEQKALELLATRIATAGPPFCQALPSGAVMRSASTRCEGRIWPDRKSTRLNSSH